MTAINKTQVSDSQYVMNIHGEGKKRKAQALAQYVDNHVFMRRGAALPQIVGSERLARLQDILAARKQGNRDAALLISVSAKVGWKAAQKRARFYANGRSEKDVAKQQVKRVSAKLKSAGWTQKDESQLVALENANEGGTGVTLELARVYEMFLAARAAFIGGYCNLRTGKDLPGVQDIHTVIKFFRIKDKAIRDKYMEINGLPVGLKAASSAASNELLRSLKEPQFEDVTQAERFNANAWRLHLQGMNEVAQTVDISRLPSRDIVARKLAEHRNRITSYWKSKGSKRWMAARDSQYRLLREIIASALIGIAYNPKKDTAQHQATKRLKQVLATQLLASDMQRINEIRLDAIAD